MSKSVQELLDVYMAQENLNTVEGRRGVEALCQIAGALGYKDPQRFGQLTQKATLGDLLAMLEDNSGLIEVMLTWIGSRNFAEFREPLAALVRLPDAAVDHYENGQCPDCGEDICPTAGLGDECDNCGHVFNWSNSDDETTS